MHVPSKFGYKTSLGNMIIKKSSLVQSIRRLLTVVNVFNLDLVKSSRKVTNDRIYFAVRFINLFIVLFFCNATCRTKFFQFLKRVPIHIALFSNILDIILIFWWANLLIIVHKIEIRRESRYRRNLLYYLNKIILLIQKKTMKV